MIAHNIHFKKVSEYDQTCLNHQVEYFLELIYENYLLGLKFQNHDKQFIMPLQFCCTSKRYLQKYKIQTYNGCNQTDDAHNPKIAHPLTINFSIFAY